MKSILFGMVVLMTLGVVWLTGGRQEVYADRKAVPPEAVADALDATVRIMMRSPTEDPSRHTVRFGLGTLTQRDGQTVIVTHDHWVSSFEVVTQIEIWNRHNELLASLDGEALAALVLYRDGGTLVLRVPDEMAVGGFSPRPRSSRSIQPGDMVLVMHQANALDPATAEVTTSEAVVVAFDEFKSRPSLTVTLVDNQQIVYGDSGGGVWHEGRLVGNMWATEVETNWWVWQWRDEDNTRRLTSVSYAALLPTGME